MRTSRVNRLPSEYFIFESPILGRSPHTETVVFAAGDRYEPSSLVQRLRQHHEQHDAPTRVVLLGTAARAVELRSLARDGALRAAVADLTLAAAPPPLALLTFDAAGTVDAQIPGHENLTTDAAQELRLAYGLRTIFHTRGGFLDATQRFHYITPSKRHTRRFIRAGNVLTDSAEIAFVAFGLLRWCPDGVRSIYTDTSSINTVAYALVELKRQFNQTLTLPAIASFSSYEGAPDFVFADPAAVCLISASTTGRLSRLLREERALKDAQIVTLFSYGPPHADSRILCDLTPRAGDGFAAAIESYEDAASCAFCRAGSAPVEIVGDQLLPKSPEVEGVLLTADDEPPWLAGFLSNVLGPKIVQCHVADPVSPEEPREIHFDLRDALTDVDRPTRSAAPRLVRTDSRNDPLRHAVRQRLLASVPAALERIVHLDDPGSKTLADAAAEIYRDQTREVPADLVVSERAARDLGSRLARGDGTILVVAGAVSSGRSLLAISQFLRDVEYTGEARDGPRTVSLSYLVAIAALPTADDLDRLRRNLTFGRVPAERPFAVACVGHLPPHAPGLATPWSREIQLLEDVAATLRADVTADPSALLAIESRRARLLAAAHSVEAGLQDELFLPVIGARTPDERKPLKLRPGFVFWLNVERAAEAETATQAQVYLTVTCLLHGRRVAQPPDPSIMHHDYNRSVLAPENFERFNDGVIQASLLRAAGEAELDYSTAPNLSERMLASLRRYGARRAEKEGEAFPEFLLALATHRLRLVPRHEALFAAELAGMELPPLEHSVAGHWLSTLRPDR